MIVGRLIGWVFFLAGLAILVRDLILWADSGVFDPITLSRLVRDVYAPSLDLAQTAIQRYLHPKLWDPAMTRFLMLWAWFVFATPGLALVILCHPREYKARWKR